MSKVVEEDDGKVIMCHGASKDRGYVYSVDVLNKYGFHVGDTVVFKKPADKNHVIVEPLED